MTYHPDFCQTWHNWYSCTGHSKNVINWWGHRACFRTACLYSKCFLPNYARSVQTSINRKICCYIAKATEYYWKLERTCLSGLKSFSKVISNCSILQSNASKLDRYIIASHSVSGSICSFTAFMYIYCPTFFLLKTCFPCTYYEYITTLKRRGYRATTSCKNSGDTSPSWSAINLPIISHTAAPLPPPPPLSVLLARQKNVGN